MRPSSAETAPSGEMRALRWWAAGDVRLDVVPVPTELPDGWVLVAVEACGICGTDLEEFLNGPVVIPTDDHPLTGAKAPLTLGHEVVGRIVASKAAQAPPVGSRVVVEGNRFCGECFWCRRHEFPLCPRLGSLGQMDNGGLADFMRAPGYMCLPLEDAIPSVEAVLVEPLSVVLRALRRKGDVEGANLVIFGGGTLGLLAIQAARALGAAEVVLVEPNEARRELALDLGASLFLHPDETSSLAERYEAGGPDAALECAGSPAAVVAAVETIRPGGTAILLGVHDGPFEIDMLPFLLQEKTLTASVSHVWDEDFPQALDLLHRGLIRTAPLITSVVPLDRTVADGFVALADHGAEHIKIAIVPSLPDPELPK